MSVVLETTLGDITVDLYIESRAQTCRNFLALCAAKYYNQCSFHLVQRDFIAQSGDPTGTGRGGDSIYAQLTPTGLSQEKKFIVRETKPKIKHDRFGLISMVNNGDGGHGSQFFFTLCDSLEYLDSVHTVFGQVAEGQDVLVKLNDTICDEKHRPYQDILITHTVVLDDPFEPIAGLVLPPDSPQINFDELAKSERIGVAEALEDDDKPAELIEEELKERDAKQRALVLEMIGDLPDADIAPPENVLFVCKLNPVTQDEDLEIIFSRFGRIVSCEVIRDEKSGDSLQYAFIEFENKEACEKAYFKMDNVLIDDRRIHVDFSQSVSKIKWHGKGRGVTINENGQSPDQNETRPRTQRKEDQSRNRDDEKWRNKPKEELSRRRDSSHRRHYDGDDRRDTLKTGARERWSSKKREYGEQYGGARKQHHSRDRSPSGQRYSEHHRRDNGDRRRTDSQRHHHEKSSSSKHHRHHRS